MPFPSRPPSPLFARTVRRAQSEAKAEPPAPPAMRLFPLELDAPPPAARQRAVNPLSQHQAPPRQALPPRTNLLGQVVSAPFAQPGAAPGAPRQAHPQMMVPPPTSPHSPMVPPRAAAPPSAESAAEQFTRVNKSLPDGVHYEPLDEETLKLLREKGHLPAAPQPTPPTPQAPPPAPQAPPPAPPPPQPTQSPLPASLNAPQAPPAAPFSPPSAPHPASPPPTVKTLEALLQDSRNAQVFYGRLATAAADAADEAFIGEAAEVFAALKTDCAAQIEQFNALLDRHFHHYFRPVEAEINADLPYGEAVKLALVEENKMLHTITDLLDNFSDGEAVRALQRILNKKIAAYHRLLLLRLG